MRVHTYTYVYALTYVYVYVCICTCMYGSILRGAQLIKLPEILRCKSGDFRILGEILMDFGGF